MFLLHVLLATRLFEEVDSNSDKHVSRIELEKVVKDIQFGKVVDAEEAVTKLLQDLDVNRDDEISENEFVDGFTKWIHSNSNKTASSKSSSHGTHQVFPLFLCDQNSLQIVISVLKRVRHCHSLLLYQITNTSMSVSFVSNSMD